MNYIRLNEKMLKHNLKKKKCRITLSLIVSFLITGSIGFLEEEVYARDLRARTKRDNEIKVDNSDGRGPTMSKSINNTDVVNIVDPNSGGISHNKFIDFSVGAENGVIFNNNATQGPVVTKTGGIVTQNPGLTNSATAILSEVTGAKTSNIDGTIEIAGQRADFILANENGITINGGGFINTSGVTLTTGRPTVNNDTINLDVKKGNISVGEFGVGTAGDYFNLVSKTIELKGRISPFSGQTDADITLIAGQNKVDIKKGSAPILKETTGHEKEENQKYGIYASSLGAMYGKNIRLVSTTEGLGVRHEGLVRSTGDINIDSAGDIAVGALISEKKITIKGKKDFETLLGDFKNSTHYQNFSVSASNGVDINVKGDIIIQSLIESGVDGIKIVGKNLTLKAKSSAKILSQTHLNIKLSGKLNIEATLVPVHPGRDPKKPPLVIAKDKNGNIIVKEPETGKILNPSDYTWESTGVIGDKIDIEAMDIINEAIITNSTLRRESYITLKALNDFINNKLISSSGDLNISAGKKLENKKNASIRGAAVKISAKEIVNAGEMRQNVSKLHETVDRGGKIEIDLANGKFTNTGTVSGYNVEIKGEGFILNGKEGRITASTEDYPRGMGSITINARNLDNMGMIQSYGQGIRNDIVINTNTLTNHLGAVIIAKKGTLRITTTVGDLLNSGEFFADKDITLVSAKNIKNSGKIAGDSLTATATSGKFENYGKISVVKKLMAHVNDFINAGTPGEITKYLAAFSAFVQENYDGVVKTINELNKKIEVSTPGSEEAKALMETLKYYQDLEVELKTLKFDVERVGALGIISAADMDIKTESNFVNDGMISSKNGIKVDSKKNLENNGLLEAGKDITLKATGDVTNTQRINAGGNLDIKGKSFNSPGTIKLLTEYLELIEKFDQSLLDKTEKEIKDLEKKLDTVKTEAEAKSISEQLKEKRKIKEQQSEYKAKINVLKGLAVIEAKNIKIAVENDVTNGGLIKSSESIDISTEKGDLVNTGIIEAIKDIILKATTGDIKNTHRIIAGEKLNITGKSFKSEGSSEKIVEYKKLLDRYTELSVKTDRTPAEETEFKELSIKILTIVGTGVVEGGSVDMTLSNGFTNEGVMNSKSHLKVNAGSGDIKNSGTMNGTTDVTLETTGGIDTVGVIKSEQESVTLKAGKDITNKGIIEAGKNIELSTTDGNILNTHRIIAGKKLTVTGKNLDSKGSAEKLKEYEKLLKDLDALNTKREKSSEDYKTIKTLEEKIVSLVGLGVISAEDIDITLKDGFTNDGTLNSKGHLKVNAGVGDIKNSGTLTGKTDVSLKTTGGIDTTGIIKSETKDVILEAGKDIKNSGILEAGKKIEIKTTNGDILNSHRITAGEGLTISGKSFKSDGDAAKLKKYNDLLEKLNLLKAKENKSETDLKTIENLEEEILNLKGLGVVSAADVDITTTNGMINEGIISSKGHVKVEAGSGDIKNNGTINAIKELIVKTLGGIDTSGVMKSEQDSVKLDAGKNITNGGILEAKKKIEIKTTTGDIENSHRIIAGEELTISGKSFKSTGDAEKLKSYNDMLAQLAELNAKEPKTGADRDKIAELEKKIIALKGLGVILAKDVDITTTNGLTNDGAITSEGHVKVEAGSGDVKNSGTINGSNEITLKTTGKIDTSGVIKSEKDSLTLDAGKNITNEGILEAGKKIEIKATDGDILNSHRIIAGEELTISGKSFKSAGDAAKLKEYNDLLEELNTLNSKTSKTSDDMKKIEEITGKIIGLKGLGVITAKDVDITVKNGMTNDGTITSKGHVKVKSDSGDIKNSGTINGVNEITLETTTGKIETTGVVKSANEGITLKAGSDITNKGILEAKKKIELLATDGNILNTHRITAGEEVTLSGKNIVLEGTKAKLDEYIKLLEEYNLINSIPDDDKTADNKAQLDKLRGQLLGFVGVSIVEGSSLDVKGSVGFANKGVINSTGKVSVDVKSDISNGGIIDARGDVTFKSENGSVVNANKITTAGKVDISGNSLTLTGDPDKVAAYRKLLQEYTVLRNQMFRSAEDLERIKEITAEILAYDELGIIEAKSIDVDVKNGVTNKGVLSAEEHISLKTIAGNITNEGIIEGGKDVTLEAKEGSISTTGILKSIDESVKLEAKGKITNKGILEAGKNIDIKSTNDEIENTHRIIAGDKLTVSAGKGFKSIGDQKKIDEYNKLLEKHRALSAKKNKSAEEMKALSSLADQILAFKDLGVIEAKNLDLTAGGIVENKGIITVENDTKITTTGNVTNAGELSSGKKLEIKGGDINNSGKFTVGSDLKLDGKNITNSKNISAGGSVDIKATGNINNNELIAKDNIVIKATGTVTSKTLETNKNINIDGSSIKIEKKLTSGESTTLKVKNSNVDFETGSKVSVKKDLSVSGGGLLNKGELTVGGKITIKKESSTNSAFENKGSLDAGSDVNIDVSKDVKNTGGFNTGGKLDIKTSGKFENTAKLQAKKDTSIKSNGFSNTNSIILGGNTNIDAGTGTFTNKSLETKGNLDIKATGEVKTTEKLQATGNIKVKGGQFNSNGIVLGNGFDLKASGDIINTGKIEAKQDIKIKGTNSKLTNNGDIKAEGNVSIDVTKDIENTKEIASGKTLTLNSKKLLNKGSGNIQGKDGVSIKINEGFTNETNAKILGGSIEIDGKSTGVSGDFRNDGTLQSNGALTVDLGTNKVNILLNSDKMKSQGLMKLITGGDIKNTGRFQNFGGLDFKSGGKIENSGMLVSNGGIKLDAQNFINAARSTVWSAKNIVMDILNEIRNGVGAAIEAKGDMTLKAKELNNTAGVIKAGKNMTLNVDKVTNKSNVTGSVWIDTNSMVESQGVDRYTGTYVNYEYVTIWLPVVRNDLKVTEKATISAGGNMDIKGSGSGNSNVTNESGAITSGKNMTIKGDITNKTLNSSISVMDILRKAKVKIYWEQKLLGTEAHWNSGTPFEGSLLDALALKKFDKNYYKALTLNASPQVNQLLSSLLGSDWKAQAKPKPEHQWNKTGKSVYYGANANAQIIAGGNFRHSGGSINNIGGETGGNKSVSVQVGDKTVTGAESNLGVTVSNPNNITETDNVKQVHKVEVQTGSVTIGGITISKVDGITTITRADGVSVTTTPDGVTTTTHPDGTTVILNPDGLEITTKPDGVVTEKMTDGVGTVTTNGGLITDLAIAGTINPVIYIEIPVGDNGIFKPARPKPDGSVPFKYETNIDFIDLSKYYGSNYFFDQIGYDPGKTSTVIGDAYYEQQLINTTIREALSYSGEVTTDQIKVMLDNAAKTKDKLGLEIGKPLTPDQVNNLDQDIVWYVEMQVEGEIVLVPQVYFGKDTRVKMATSDMGGGHGSEIKAGGNIDIDATNVVNSNGNITSGGNITIKSENDIVNNSAGGFGGGIAGKGDISLDAKNNIDMTGGTVKSSEGDASLKAGGDIVIESGLGFDKNGNQKVSDKAGVQGKGDVKIEAKGDLTVKGGSIESTGEKDVTLSGGNVTITDQNLTGSSIEQSSSGGVTTTTTEEYSKSSGTTVAGGNVKITSENDVTIQGSDVVAKKDVSIDAKNDVNILDGQDIISKKTEFSGIGTDDEGLIFVKSGSSELEATKSKGSTVGGLDGVDITSGGNTTIKGSDLISGEGGIDITSKGDVNIIDGQDTIKTKSDSTSFNGIGLSKEASESKTTTSKGSGITTKGDINIKAENDVKVVGSDLNALGDTSITAGNDVKFEAGKNTHEETSNSINVGVTSADASAGVAGKSASAGWTPDGGGATDIVDGNPEKPGALKGGALGKNYMDSLTSAKTQIGVDIQSSSEKSVTWTESDVKTGGDLTIKAGNTADIGGADFTSGGDINIEAKQVDTTKYEDVVEKESSSTKVGVQVSNNTTSSIADAVNKGMQIADTINDETKALNEGLTSAQVAGSVSNIIFGDLAGNTTAVTGELGLSKSSSKTTKENTTDIKAGGNINIKSTDGNINLTGVDIKGNDITLDSSNEINIKDAKETHKEESSNLNVSAGGTFSTGVSIIDGGYAQGGVVANVQAGNSYKDNELSNGSKLDGNNITIKSGGNTNVIGSNITGENVDLDVKGDLNVTSVADKYDESRTEGWGGIDVSVGAATNTIGTGDIGLSAGGGTIYKKGEEVKNQAGIVAKDKFTGNVGGDANLTGAEIGSKSGEGSLVVGGDLNIKDLNTQLDAGGQIIGGNIGTKGGGVQGEVGDIIDKNVTSKGGVGLDPNNVTVGGDVTLEGNKVEKDKVITGKVEGDGIVVNKDVVKGGGTFSGTATAVPVKKKKGSYDVDKVDGPIPPPKKNDDEFVDYKVVEGPGVSKGPVPPPLNVDPPGITPPPPPTLEPPKLETKREPIPPKKVEIEIKVDKPIIKKVDSEEVVIIKPEKPVIITPDPKPDPDPNPIVNGYQKNAEGKWIKVVNTGMGIVGTNGSITSKKALDGYQEGVKSLNKGETSVPNPNDVDIKRPEVSQGVYKKDTNGKWIKSNSSGPEPVNSSKNKDPETGEKNSVTITPKGRTSEPSKTPPPVPPKPAKKDTAKDTSGGDGWTETLVTKHSEGPSIYNDNMSPNEPPKPSKTPPPVPPKPNKKVAVAGGGVPPVPPPKPSKTPPPVPPKPSINKKNDPVYKDAGIILGDGPVVAPKPPKKTESSETRGNTTYNKKN